MRKKILIACLSCIILFVGIWFFPIFRSIDEENFDIMEYADDDNIAVICEIIDATDAYWYIIDSSDPNCKSWSNRGFDVTGNVPSKILKYPMYYYKSKFIFVGNFTENKKTQIGETRMFEVKKWYFLGDIDRGFVILPYPKRGPNFMEINWKQYIK